ncbi:MAG: nuclear transport factor 2 family protein [Methanobacterium sp.]|uniref:nuclear transport factor 2 family protein n=1 Tax=Methanobacterium sp. TaxID=2164 RepID=UPI003D645F86|nr:nuclear transport factor 2 family protein [Methanobacterium sp.]
MEADNKIEAEVMNMLDKYVKAYENKDIEALMNLFVDDPNLVAIGTGKDEWVEGHKKLKTGFKRDFSQAENIDMGFEKITISNSGNVAWVSSLMTMNAEVSGGEVLLCGRLSLILEKKDNKWLFTHLHFSVPAIEQEKGRSFPE